MDQINKKSYEKFPIYVDFSTDLDTGEVINTFTVACVNTISLADTSGSIVASSTGASSKVKVVIQGGVIDETHKITVKGVTNFNSAFEKDVFLRVVENSEGYFTKQPNDRFTVTYDFTNDLEAGDTIIATTVTGMRVVDGVDDTVSVIDGSFLSTPKVNVGVKGGTSGLTYKLIIKASTQAGYQYQGDLMMIVREI